MNGFDDFDTQIQSDELSDEYLADESVADFLAGHVWEEAEDEYQPMYPADEGFADFWDTP